ncbi:MAG: hypothetical protein GTO63_34975, partial [Anaerolineae bacterium]|nr:hypothetical protein [Anaerolineae bacterium]
MGNRSIIRRFFGLIIILRALLPLILILALALIARQFLREVRAGIETPLQEINSSLDEIRGTIATARDSFDVIDAQLTEMDEALEEVSAAVGNIPVSASLNLGTLPVPDGFSTQTLTILGIRFTFVTGVRTRNVSLADEMPIPGLGPVKSFFSDTFGFFDNLSGILSDIVALVSVTAEVNDIVREVRKIVFITSRIGSRWGTIVALLILFSVVVWILS